MRNIGRRTMPGLMLAMLSVSPLVCLTSASAPAAAIGDFGLDLSARKPDVRPGDDFFAYAEGDWLDHFEIPADRSFYGVFTRLADLSDERLRTIIEDATSQKPKPGTPEQKISDFYGSFMDEARIEALHMSPAAPDLARINRASTKHDIAVLMGSVGFASLFKCGVGQDPKDPSRYTVRVSQSGLGLPNRDYYIKDDPVLNALRSEYLHYIETMLRLGSEGKQAARHASEILTFETRVAMIHWPIDKRRDVEATNNPRTRAEILEQLPGFDWMAFLTASGLGHREQFVVRELSALERLAALIRDTPVSTLTEYLRFHYLSDHANVLPEALDEAHFAFYGRALLGQPKERERWKRGVQLVSGALGEQVGQSYVAKYFSPESKSQMEALVANLLAALKVRIETLDWMTPETKARALEKVATFMPKIGYPTKWRNYATLEIRRDDLFGNARRAAIWEWNYDLARLERPVDRAEWGMTPQTVDAYYNPLNNEIVFPAAILQPPFFDPNADAAVNYGAIGAVIGHEMGHGFDDQGRKFGPDGRLADWWTPVDAAAYAARTQRLVQQYSAFVALPGLHVNGAATLGENIGDLGGLNMAYEAYHRSLGGKEAPVIGGLTGDQRFFLAWAQIWRTKYRDEALRAYVFSNVHSPPMFRVNGAVRNVDAWYRAFGVEPTDALYVPPKDRVSIW